MENKLQVKKAECQNKKYAYENTFHTQSSIMSRRDFAGINDWLDSDWKNSRFTMIYRGSSQGMYAHSFHSNCDNQGSTIVVMKSNHNKIFGGFNPNNASR